MELIMQIISGIILIAVLIILGISAVIMLIDQLQIRKERKQLQKIFEEDFKKLRESVLKLEENTTKK